MPAPSSLTAISTWLPFTGETARVIVARAGLPRRAPHVGRFDAVVDAVAQQVHERILHFLEDALVDRHVVAADDRAPLPCPESRVRSRTSFGNKAPNVASGSISSFLEFSSRSSTSLPTVEPVLLRGAAQVGDAAFERAQPVVIPFEELGEPARAVGAAGASARACGCTRAHSLRQCSKRPRSRRDRPRAGSAASLAASISSASSSRSSSVLHRDAHRVVGVRGARGRRPAPRLGRACGDCRRHGRCRGSRRRASRAEAAAGPRSPASCDRAPCAPCRATRASGALSCAFPRREQISRATGRPIRSR